MGRLAFTFLGGFQVVRDDRQISAFKSNKVRALLAYLVVESGRPHRRETLAGLLWPDRTDRDALSNLRYALASLRTTLGERGAPSPLLLIARDTIQFNGAGGVWVDVLELERSIAAFRAQPWAGNNTLISALRLYRGAFLEGFSVGGAAPFEEWVTLRREQIAQQLTAALGAVVSALEVQGDLPAAVDHAQRHVALEPWNEQAHRALMRVLALSGQRTAALHQFQVCRQTLWSELGVEPAEETIALQEAIRAGRALDDPACVAGGNADGAFRQQEPIPPLDLAASPVGPVVARENQLAQLKRSLDQALSGAGHVVFVTGEAGSGKSVLLAEFARRAMAQRPDLLVASGVCDSLGGIGDPYLPFRDILQLLTGDIEPRRAGAGLTPEHARRLWAAIPDAVQVLVAEGPDLINSLVPGASLELRTEAFARQSARGVWQPRLAQLVRSSNHRGVRSAAPLQSADLCDQVTRVLQILARRHPLCLLLDDLQWIDSGSASLLFHLGRRIAGSRILVIGAYRPDAIAPAANGERHPLEQVVNELERNTGREFVDLDACSGRLFVDAFLDIEPNELGADFREQLLSRTEGHPLFTVELLRSMRDRDELVHGPDGRWRAGHALDWRRLPTRVEAAIAERINRLPEHCLSLLAAASVEGTEFTAEVVARILNARESTILQCLGTELSERHRLVTAASLHRLGGQRLSRYRFRHNLFQRFLYQHMDAVRRASLHESVASALETLHGTAQDEMEVLAPRLAWHFEMAGLLDRAAAYYLRAGRRAAHLGANEDAIGHLSRGLALLEQMPESPQRVRREFELRLAIILPQAFARGFWSSERTDALKQVFQLSQRPELRDSPERAEALAAVAYFALWSAEPGAALRAGEELIARAERSGDEHDLLIAHCLVGTGRWLLGDIPQARAHLDVALALLSARGIQPQDMLFGFHVGAMSLAWHAGLLWMTGQPDQAKRRLDESLRAAEATGSPVTLAYTQAAACVFLSLLARDSLAAWQQVEALRSLQQISVAFDSFAEIIDGRRSLQAKREQQGLLQMRQGMAALQSVGGALSRAAQLLILAQGCALTGQVQEGLEAVDEAMAWMNRTGVRLYEAEAHRLRGELMLERDADSDAASQAMACFRRAIAIAQSQGATWLSLRAATSLCRLLVQDVSRFEVELAEASAALAGIYGRFEEGFDTPDLVEARAVLASFDGLLGSEKA